MAFCGACGTQVQDGVKFCPDCGGAMAAVPSGPPPAHTSPTATDADIRDNKVMGILAYCGVLVLIPWFAAPDSKFARFHARQGIHLAILEVGYLIIRALLGLIKTPHSYSIWGIETGVYYTTPGIVITLQWLLSIPLAVLAVIGILNVLKGKMAELPVIGKFSFIK